MRREWQIKHLPRAEKQKLIDSGGNVEAAAPGNGSE